jgi:hypothetical protein
VEGRQVAHHLFIHILLVCVDGLGVLAKVVEPGKMLSTVTVKRTLSGVFSDVSREMLASAEDHSTVAIPPALEGFGGDGAITLVDASTGDVGEVVDRQRVWMGGHRGGGRGRDDGGHERLVLAGVQGGLNLHLPLCRTTRDSPLKGA